MKFPFRRILYPDTEFLQVSLSIHLEAGLGPELCPQNENPLEKIVVSTVDFTEDCVRGMQGSF